VITLGDSDQLEVGDWVIAIGNPFRLTSTVTAGIVSAKNRQIQIFENEFGIEDFIQTDAAINPGNSGGALVNLQGQLVGINTAIATERGSYEGYGFAVPVNLMTHVVGDLIAYGEVYRGYLGVQIMSVDAVDAQRLGMDMIAGVRVERVVQASAAERAGIRVDDVILSIDGFEVNASNQLQSRIARHHPGDSVGIELWRDGKIEHERISLLGRDHVAREDWVRPPDVEEIPDPAPETPFQLPEWGIGLKDLTEAERDAFGVDEGAYIAYIQGGTPASIDGLPRDVVITFIEGESVANVEEAFRLFDLAYAEEEETLLIRVKRRDGLSAFYEVQVPTLD
jgi:S1-C subfamily serine protease